MHPRKFEKRYPDYKQYSFQAALESESYINIRINECISQLYKHSSSGKTLDLAQWLEWLALDVVMDVAFSEPVRFVKEARDVGGLISSIHEMFLAIIIMVNFPGIVRVLQLPFIWPLIAPKDTDKTGAGATMRAANNAIRNRMEQGNTADRRDMLQHFLEYRDLDGKSMTRQEIEIASLTPV